MGYELAYTTFTTFLLM